MKSHAVSSATVRFMIITMLKSTRLRLSCSGSSSTVTSAPTVVAVAPMSAGITLRLR